MKKLLSLLLVATIITSTLCVSYFAFDNVDNLSNITTSEPTDKEIETSTISTSDEATPDEITTEPSSPTTESSTIESSTEPSSPTTESSTIESSTEPSSSTTESSTIESSTEPSSSTTESSTIESSTEPTTTKPTDIKVSSIKLNTKNHTMYSNQYVQLKATVLPNNAYNKSVTWKANNTKVVTVDKKGKIKATTNKGATYVNAIAKDGSKKKAKLLVVVGPKVKKITLNKTSVTLNRGAKNRTFQLKKAIKNKNATYKGVSWYSSNKNVATVDNNGKVTVLKKGTVTITAKAKDGSNKSAKCKFTVKQLVTKLSYNNKKQVKEVYKNKTIKFAVTVVPSNANNKGLTYSSSNKKVATVNSKGVVKGIKAGTVTITAKAKDGSRKVVKLTVKVKNPPISVNTKLTIKQLKSKSIVKRHCDMLNNYFKSCGATIEPRLKGQHQWYVEDTSGYCVDNFVSLNYWYTETLSYWIQEMSGDFLNNNDDWNDKGYLKDSNKYADFLNSFIYWDKNGYPQYRKNLILDSKYNGFDWLINTYTKKTNKFLVYVDFEKFKIKGKDYKDKDGNQEYVIKFYYNWQSIEDYNNHKDPRD